MMLLRALGGLLVLPFLPLILLERLWVAEGAGRLRRVRRGVDRRVLPRLRAWRAGRGP